ncbi:MAG: calcineurin-like phosphoesterase family protein [Polyangiales bacterium]
MVDEGVTHIAGERVRMSHFPPAHYHDPRYPGSEKRYVDRRPKLNKGEWLVHGHTHNKERLRGKCIHVGVDAWNLGPVRGEDVAALIREARDA